MRLDHTMCVLMDQSLDNVLVADTRCQSSFFEQIEIAFVDADTDGFFALSMLASQSCVACFCFFDVVDAVGLGLFDVVDDCFFVRFDFTLFVYTYWIE